MSVDAGIFALRAKKYFWYDRDYNLQGWRYVDPFYDANSEDSERADLILDAMRKSDKENGHVDAEEALFLAELSKRAWESGDLEDSHRIRWCENVIAFIKMFPGDVFSLKSDHGDEWPECCDRYEEIPEDYFIEVDGDK